VITQYAGPKGMGGAGHPVKRAVPVPTTRDNIGRLPAEVRDQRIMTGPSDHYKLPLMRQPEGTQL